VSVTPDASAQIFVTPLSQRLFSLFGTLLVGAVSLGMIGLAVVLIRHSTIGWFVALVGIFMAALTGYAGRDLAGRWGLRIALGSDAVTLDLPSGRSLIHRPKTQHLTIPYADIAAVETRLEAYRTLGMAMMQRAYVLRRKSGETVFLFEDRALATGFQSSMFREIAGALVARAHVNLDDHGMVEGGGGVLGVWGTRAEDWSAPSLPLAQQLRLWRHAAATGSLAIAMLLIITTLMAAKP
jgi:hypothetical protein